MSQTTKRKLQKAKNRQKNTQKDTVSFWPFFRPFLNLQDILQSPSKSVTLDHIYQNGTQYLLQLTLAQPPIGRIWTLCFLEKPTFPHFAFPRAPTSRQNMCPNDSPQRPLSQGTAPTTTAVYTREYEASPFLSFWALELHSLHIILPKPHNLSADVISCRKKLFLL